MSRTLVLRPEARDEVNEAAAWFEARRSGLGVDFRARVEAAIESIRARPFLHPIVHPPVRRALVRRFPYAIFYVVSEAEIIVLACMHGRRDPRRWRSRL